MELKSLPHFKMMLKTKDRRWVLINPSTRMKGDEEAEGKRRAVEYEVHIAPKGRRSTHQSPERARSIEQSAMDQSLSGANKFN